MVRTARLFLVPLLAMPMWLHAQSAREAGPPNELFGIIARLDTALFESFNKCDLEKFTTFFTEDVEFFHDQSGLTIGAKTVTDQVKKQHLWQGASRAC